MEERIQTVKRIAITGPESSGKTTLTKLLATHFNTHYVEEYSRLYLANLSTPYQIEDVIAIAKGQIQLENELIPNTTNYLFCDTDLLVIKVWLEYRYGSCPDWITQALQQQRYNLHLLCTPDIAWVYDPLRENENNRAQLFELYLNILRAYNLNYVIINGQGKTRIQQAIEAIKTLSDN